MGQALVWFDIAREHTNEWGKWNHARLFQEPTGPTEPLLPRFDRIKPNMDDLRMADGYIRIGDLRAAAVYAWAVYEELMRSICKFAALPIAYNPNPKEIKVDVLWRAILRKHATMLKSGGEFLNPALIPLLSAVRSQVLNRLSHSGSSSLTSLELQAAVTALSQLRSDLSANPKRIPFKK